jgi:nickel-dependent lactate racemase
MTKIQLPYGSTQLDLEIEAELLDGEEEHGRRRENIDPRKVIKHALDHPLGTKRLREIVATKRGAKIVIVVDDHTRATPTVQMLDALMEEIAADFKNQITLLVACGTHEPPTDEDLRRILGTYVGQYPIKIHDCDAKDLVYVGSTSRGTPVRLNRNYVDADMKILTGDVTLHYYAGFGGGRKSILPGISSRETIQKNHALLTDEHARTANLDRNPVHLDMTEAAAFCPPDFVLNIVAEGDNTVVDAFAGELNEVFSKGTQVAHGLFCRETPLLYDILIVSAGGFPKDRNLYQASKAIENCYRAVVPGGKMILVAECREGIGDTYFAEWMTACTSYKAAEECIRSNFVLGGHKAYYMRLAMTRLSLSVVSRLDSQLLTRWGIQAYKTLGEALEATKKDKSEIGIVKKGVDTLLVPAVK